MNLAADASERANWRKVVPRAMWPSTVPRPPRGASVLVGTSIGQWLGGTFGAFVAALVSVPLAGALQIIVRELWQATAGAGG